MTPQHKMTPDDIVIVFMGSTGTGKSLLIDLLTNGIIDQKAHKGLKPTTTRITPTRVRDHGKYGDRIVLIDTPSFDDPKKSDMEILDEISQWLAKTYTNKIGLTGLIYLHRITDNRMGGSLIKYLRVFQNLCGQPSLDRVVLVSTMWHEARSPEAKQKAEMRYKELKTKFWEPLINAGSKCDCLESASRQEAWRIIDELIECSLAKRSDVRLQGEIVNDGKPLVKTEAGQELVPAAQKRITELADNLQHLTSEIEKLKRTNPALAKEMMKEQKHIRNLLDKECAIANKYKIPFTERIRKVFRKLFGKNKPGNPR